MTIPKRYVRLFIVVALLVPMAMASGGYQEDEASVEDDSGADSGGGGGEKKDDEQLFEFKTPDMTEEEQHSQHMPVHMLCDGCALIAAMMRRQFDKTSRRKSGLIILPESEIIEAVEAICEANYEDYGAKEVDGVLRLTGPHTEVENVPGVTSGGGKWPNRIKQLCSRYWDELGDEEMYAAWRDEPNNFHRYLCFSPNRPRDACYKSKLAKADAADRKHLTENVKQEEDARQKRIAKLLQEQKKVKSKVHSEF